MKDRNIIITGAASGIGREVAKKFARVNPKGIMITDIHEEGLWETKRTLGDSGVKVHSQWLDVADPDSIRQGFDRIVETMGDYHVLINCAGICRETPFDQITVDEWDYVLQVNLRGTFLCCQRAIADMQTQGIKGTIVNVSSIAAKVGGLAAGAHYSASKAGVSCVTIAAARYAGRFGIRVNAVAPGPIDNSMTENWDEELKAALRKNSPLGRFGSSEQVANAIFFLAGDQADHIVGEILDVNGGAYMD